MHGVPWKIIGQRNVPGALQCLQTIDSVWLASFVTPAWLIGKRHRWTVAQGLEPSARIRRQSTAALAFALIAGPRFDPDAVARITRKIRQVLPLMS